MEQRISDMRCKEVISITDGKRLGYVFDVLFSVENGRMTSVILPGKSKLFGLLGREDDYRIPWECIRHISEDIVLVEVKQYIREKRKSRFWI